MSGMPLHIQSRMSRQAASLATDRAYSQTCIFESDN